MGVHEHINQDVDEGLRHLQVQGCAVLEGTRAPYLLRPPDVAGEVCHYFAKVQ